MRFLNRLCGKQEEPVVLDLQVCNHRLAEAQHPIEPDAFWSHDQAQHNIVAQRVNQRDQMIDTLNHLKRARYQTFDDPAKGVQVRKQAQQ